MLERIGTLAGGADRRGDARHVRVLPDARPHHPGAHPHARVRDRRGRGRLARRARASIATCRPFRTGTAPEESAFARFPTWMWRNRETCGFVEWLRVYNAEVRDPREQAALLRPRPLQPVHARFVRSSSIWSGWTRRRRALARERYACLTPWQADPAGLRPRRHQRPLPRLREGGGRDAARHAEPASSSTPSGTASGSSTRCRTPASSPTPSATTARCTTARSESWNLRDRHMFETLERCSRSTGRRRRPSSGRTTRTSATRSATEMGARGELNLGQLCRQRFGDAASLVGFGTDHGTVAAAHDWDGPMRGDDRPPGAPRELRAAVPRVGRRRLPAASPRAERDRRCAPSWRQRGSSAPMGVDLPAGDRAPEPLLPRRRCPSSSTSTSGSMRRTRCDPSRWRRRRRCRRSIRSAPGRPRARAAWNELRPVPREIEETLRKLDWMRREGIWPNGLRYLWTDAFGVVLLVSLAEDLRDDGTWTRRSGWWRRSRGCSAGRAASASARPPIAMASTSTTSRCGCSRSTCSRSSDPRIARRPSSSPPDPFPLRPARVGVRRRTSRRIWAVSPHERAHSRTPRVHGPRRRGPALEPRLCPAGVAWAYSFTAAGRGLVRCS